MKSQLTENMLQVWEALSLDSVSLCATSSSESARDIERLRINVLARGLNTFVLDLPTIDSVLTSLLEHGSVDFKGPFMARRSKLDRRPRFLWAYWRLVCDVKGCLLSEPDVDAIAAIRLMSCFMKKYEVKCSANRIEDAIKEYYAIEEQIVPPRLNWGDDHLHTGDTNTSFASSFSFLCEDSLLSRVSIHTKAGFTQFLKRLDKVAGILVSELGSFDSMSPESPETGFFKHGPGAVSNLRGSEYKYSFPYWSDKLEGLFPFDWCSGAPLGSFPTSKVERPSALLAVPKTAKAPRLIASEPVEHQWCQQKVLSYINHHMRISLIGKFFSPSNQSLSQEMVAQASLDRTLSTLDLSSASDRVSCRHVEALFRANETLLHALHATRTRWIEDRVTGRDPVKLKKFASMGSALTFPVQSIFFLAVALASCGAASKRDILNLVGSVRVFGDDIIVPSYAYNRLASNLNRLGLKVNLGKSFSKSLFRESCGLDCWNGYDVTPVKPKSLSADTLEGIESLIDTSNNLHLKGWWFGARAVARLLPNRYKRSIWSFHSNVAGLKSFSGTLRHSLKWDDNLHHYYTPSSVVIKTTEKEPQHSSTALREHFTRPHSDSHPRELGVMRIGVAKVATTRVVANKLPVFATR